LEAAGGNLTLEVVALGGLQSTRVAVVVQGAEGVEAAASIKVQPVADGTGTEPSSWATSSRDRPWPNQSRADSRSRMRPSCSGRRNFSSFLRCRVSRVKSVVAGAIGLAPESAVVDFVQLQF